MQILNAPRIAGLDTRYVERQLRYYRDGIRGAHELDTAGALMRPILIALAGDDAIKNVAAYIETMPAEPQPITVLGDIERGEALYINCAVCHGAEGQGIWALNAPALAGQSDWYLVTQLKNFKDEIRGAHRLDLYGDQMMMMADILSDDQDIDNVVAYLNTFR
jgi:cytochrome c oxidase subunit 2